MSLAKRKSSGNEHKKTAARERETVFSLLAPVFFANQSLQKYTEAKRLRMND